MTTAAVRGLVRQIAQDEPPSDGELLTRYARARDNEAFAELLRRHGPVVFGVCRRLLVNQHDAEDAFQAVFLVLARKVESVRPPGMVGNWLYGVAVRTAKKAKLAATRRWRREMATAMASRTDADSRSTAELSELRAVIDDELSRLPVHLRAAVVLCDLGGKSNVEASREMGCPAGTIGARLHQARKLLAERLTRRGVALSAAGLGAALTPEASSAAVSTDLARATLAVAETAAAGAASPAISPTVQALAGGVIRTMASGKFKLSAAAMIVGLLTGFGVLWGAPSAESRVEVVGVLGTVTPTLPGPVDSPKPHAALGSVQAIEFSQDGKRYSVVAGGKATVHDADTARALYTVDAEAARFTSDNRTLATVREKSIGWLDRETGKELKSFPRPKTNLAWHLVSFSPDGKRYAAHFGFQLRVYDTETGFEPIRLDNQHEPGGSFLGGAMGKQLLWSPDGKQVVAVGMLVADGKLGAAGWEVETGKRFYAFEATLDDGPRAAAFSSDSKSLAVAYKGRVDVWTGGLNPARGLDANGIPTALAFAADGKTIAVGVRKPVPVAFWAKPEVKHKSEVVVLDAKTGKEVRRFAGFEDGKATTSLPVTALAFSPEAKTLLAGTGLLAGTPGDGGNPKLGEVKSFSLEAVAPPNAPPAAGRWRQQAVLNDNEDSFVSVAFAPDGKTFAAGGSRRGRGNVTVWNATTHAKHLWYSHDDIRPEAAAVAYSPDSAWLAFTNKDGASLIETATWKLIRSIKEKDVTPTSIAFGPSEKVDGHKQTRLALTDGRSVSAKSWLDEATEGTAQFGPLTNPPKDVGPLPAAVAYSPDGKQLVFIPNHKMDPNWVSGSKKNLTHWFAHVWGGGSGAAMYPLLHGTEPVTAVAWSKDGKLIATGGADGDVAFWDSTTFKELRRVNLGGRGVKGIVHALAFAPDGQNLAAAVTQDEGKDAQRVVLIEPTTCKRVQDLLGFNDAPPIAVAFSPDSKTLIVGCGFRGTDPRKLPLDDPKKIGEVRVFAVETPETKRP
jgi:RNA polymerase sigma factor (sigma-70 family)